HFRRSLVGDAERECHARPTWRCNDANTLCGFEGEVRLIRMLCINTVPALCNTHRRSVEKAGDVIHYELINFFAIEDIDAEPIFVVVAERELGGCWLRRKSVSARSRGMASFMQDPSFERGERVAHSEGWIQPQRQAGRKRWPKAPSSGLGLGPQHLQLYAGESGASVHVRVKGLEIVTAADDCTIHFPRLVPTYHARQIDIPDSGTIEALYAESPTQIGGQGCKRRAWIDG